MIRKILLFLVFSILILLLLFLVFSDSTEKFENIQTLDQSLRNFYNFKGNPFINDNGKILNQIYNSKVKAVTLGNNGYYVFPEDRITELEFNRMIDNQKKIINKKFTITPEFIRMLNNLSEQRPSA